MPDAVPAAGPTVRWGIFGRAAAYLSSDEPPDEPGDFSTSRRVLPISVIALFIGALSACVAWVLLKLIYLFTNIFFFVRFSTQNVSPADNTIGWWVLVVPVIGGIIVGIMARYGSERIRGHGIPEALEAILINGSKMEPKVTVLKPISSAIAIGSGGPFGAEGPIIVSGGALGSMIAQLFHLSSTERRTLLVAGAAGGMSATFASPVAAVLLAVELLLFEWKPRSLIPVALSSAMADLIRRYLLGAGPVFPVPPHATTFGPAAMGGAVLLGVFAAGLGVALTLGIYAAEDTYKKLPVHWMWWPAIGGIFVGVGGMIFPRALGVGYGTIGDILQGDNAATLVAGVLLIKSTMWAISLGSGTSGGVLAPQLMMGAALGAMLSSILPNLGAGFWPMIGMAAVLAVTMRVPFTGIVFAVELTHDTSAMLPMLVAVVIAYLISVLVLRRSILTEKVARRGYNVATEYALDPLELLSVSDVMRTSVVVLSPDLSIRDVATRIAQRSPGKTQRLYPVVDDAGSLRGITTRTDLEDLIAHHQGDGVGSFAESVIHEPSVAFADEPLVRVANRMADTGFTRLPVVTDDDARRLIGIISLDDVLKGRVKTLHEERHRERVLRLRFLLPGRGARTVEDRVSVSTGDDDD